MLLARAAAADGRPPPLVLLPEPGPLVADLEAAGAEVRLRPGLAVLRRAGATPGGLVALARAAGRDARALAALARRERVAVVHANTSVVLGGLGAGRIAGVPHVVHVREIYAGDALGRAWPAWRRVLDRGTDAFACVSGAVAAQFGRGPEVRVLHDGLPPAVLDAVRPSRLEARGRLGLAADRFAVAVLGRLSPWKGQDVLARALAEPGPADRGTIGLVAGDAWRGEEARETALRDLGAALDLGDRLRFLGFRDDPETVLAAADAVVVPSTRPDPFPNTALEALAAGRPVVAAAHGGLPEMLDGGRAGRLVPPGDPVALAAALEALATDPAAAAALGAAGAAHVRARFTEARLTAGVRDLWDAVAGRGRGRR